MLKLSTVKGRGCLDEVTKLKPKTKNETRWTSVMKMMKRCEELLPFLRQISASDAVKCGLEKVMLTATDALDVSKLLVDLRNFESVTIELQSENLTMLQVRDLFDHTIDSYPATKKYLGPNASIVNNPVFERALVKLQAGRRLTPPEKAACVRFVVPGASGGSAVEATGHDSVLDLFAKQAFKRRRIEGTQEALMATDFVPPTSNICERLFSQSKLIFTDQKRAMRPATLEMFVFLKANRSLW